MVVSLIAYLLRGGLAGRKSQGHAPHPLIHSLKQQLLTKSFTANSISTESAEALSGQRLESFVSEQPTDTQPLSLLSHSAPQPIAS